jgi:hypothetical protein
VAAPRYDEDITEELRAIWGVVKRAGVPRERPRPIPVPADMWLTLPPYGDATVPLPVYRDITGPLPVFRDASLGLPPLYQATAASLEWDPARLRPAGRHQRVFGTPASEAKPRRRGAGKHHRRVAKPDPADDSAA